MPILLVLRLAFLFRTGISKNYNQNFLIFIQNIS